MFTEGFVRSRVDGIDLHVRLTPKASRDAFKGTKVLADGRTVLCVRVRAVPEKNAANAALEKLIAKQLKLTASAVQLRTRTTSRLKTVSVSGDPVRLVAAALKLAK